MALATRSRAQPACRGHFREALHIHAAGPRPKPASGLRREGKPMTSPTLADPAEVPATSTFRDLGVSSAAAGALEKRGYTSPLPVQAMVLPDILEGRDILAKS